MKKSRVIPGAEYAEGLRAAYLRAAARIGDPRLAQPLLDKAAQLATRHFEDVVLEPRGGPPCGRPTAKGTPCRRAKAACDAHLTAAEREERASLKARAQEPHRLYLQDPPSCHLWDPPAPGQWWWEWQGDRCANCGYGRGALVTDHCHRTGLDRGYLCRPCNTMEGRGAGRRWQLYRARPPSVICGGTHPYEGWGARGPEPWVVHVLGPVPSTPPARAEYLSAAVGLVWSDHFDLFTGRPRAAAARQFG